MKNVLIFIWLICILNSCGYMPQVLQEAENIIDDDAITITVSREAIQRQTNLKAIVELDNGQTK